MNAKNMLTTMKVSVSKFTGRTGLKIQKYSPEILLGAGIIGFVGTVVLACKATLAADDILENHAEQMENIEEAKKITEEQPDQYEYDEDLYKRDKLIVTTKTAVSFVKLYAPAVAVGGLSLACILMSRNIMQRRYLGAVSALNAVTTAFYEYRERVRAEEGELMDRHYRYGTELETVETPVVDPETGKKTKVKEVKEKAGTAKIPEDDTARFFCEGCRNWDRNPEFSMMFLRGMQNAANDILRTRGHIFLNEVYDMLGYDHTQAGAILGWVMGMGDDFVDFGLYDPEKARAFVNGTDNTILLEFNHDGPIWDKI